MTDFLSRLAARITAPESGLRPNAPARFEPTPGLGGEASLFEVNEEREVRAPAPRRFAAAAPGPMPPQPGAPPLASSIAASLLRAPSHDVSEPAGASQPVPSTLAVVQTGQTGFSPRRASEGEPPLERFQARVSAQPADPASPPQPATLQPPETNHTAEHHYHQERVIERVVTTADGQTAAQAQPVAPQAARFADEAGVSARRQAAPTPAPDPQQIRQALQAAPQHPAPPMREAFRPAREPHPEPPQPAPVVVRIDRLEVRVAPPRTAAPAASSRPAQPATDLDRYLANLEGRRS